MEITYQTGNALLEPYRYVDVVYWSRVGLAWQLIDPFYDNLLKQSHPLQDKKQRLSSKFVDL